MTNADVIFHIADGEEWKKSLELGEYRCASLDTEGFIHFSLEGQVVPTANRHFHGVYGLVLLRVRTANLSARLKYELAPIGELFPHLYGPLNLDAVEKVLDFPCNPDGSFSIMPDKTV